MTAAVLTSIQVIPDQTSIHLGTVTYVLATGIYSDGTSQNISDQVAWSVADTTILQLGNLNSIPEQKVQSPDTGNQGTVSVTATLGSVSGSANITVTSAALVSIQISPTNPTVANGLSQNFTATGTFSDNSTQDLTNSVTWSSSDITIATISNASGGKGIASTLSAGSTNISATLSGVSSDTSVLMVTAASLESITITPGNPTTPKGTSIGLTATGIYSDGTSSDLTMQVTWSSSNASIGTVDNTPGKQGTATGVSSGSANVLAMLNGVNASVTFKVTNAILTSIQVTPDNTSIPLGTSTYAMATGVYSDGSSLNISDQVIWTSSDGTVLQIGVLTSTPKIELDSPVGGNQGTVNITATLGSTNGSTSITVTSATLSSIQINPTNPSIALGLTQNFTAIGTYSDTTTKDLTNQVAWNSANTSVATVSSASGSSGLSTSIAVGTSDISASLGGVTSPVSTLTVTAATLQSITITPGNPSTPKGRSMNLTATGIFSDGSFQNLTTQVTWSSSSNSTVTMDNASGSEGQATGVNTGTATVSATLNGVIGNSPFKVTNAILNSIQVAADENPLHEGTSTYVQATGVYSDGTSLNISDQVTWSTSDNTIVQLGTLNSIPKKNIIATGGSLGTATVSATLGAITGSSDITVITAALVSIAITPTNPSVALGLTQSFMATGTYTDGSTQDLTNLATWNSASTNVATISNANGSQGIASTVSIGTSDISATYNSITSATSTLTVTAATLESITITPSLPTVPKGRSTNLTATGTYSDGSWIDLTTQVTWGSNNTSVVTLDNATGRQGKASGITVGQTNITAVLGSVSTSATFQVTNAVLTSLEVYLNQNTIALGTSTYAQAIGTYSDGTTLNISDQVSWGSSNTSAVQLGNLAAGPQKILNSAPGSSQGTSSISANLGSISGSSNLTVTAASLVSIQINPTNPSVALGLPQTFKATGTYSDGSTLDISTQVTWVSSATNIATISNANGSQGQSSTLQTGSTNITASLSGVTSPASILTVTSPTLTSITIAPNPTLSIAKGRSQNFTAIGNYTDGSTQDLTIQATWTSSDPSKATVSNAQATSGLVTAIQIGSANISATYNSVTSTATAVTITAAVLTSIQVAPVNYSLPKGNTANYTANGVYSDGTTLDITTQVTWASSVITRAVISNASGNNGLLTATGTGGTTISATLGSISGSTNLTVTAAQLVSISVSPTAPSIYQTQTQNFVATGTYTDTSTQNITTSVTWTSSSTSIATVSNSSGTEGKATGVNAGTATITATLGALSGNTTLTVNAVDLTPPILTNVVSLTPTSIRVTFSESLATSGATTASNYKIALTSALSGTCSDNSNFTSSSSALTVSSVSGSGAVYVLTLSSAQTSGVGYTLVANKPGITDLSPLSNTLSCPNYGDFVGQEQLKVTSAACASVTSVIVSFSKPIKSGTNTTGSAECSTTTECAKRYSFIGTSSLGTVNSAKILDGIVCGGAAADSSKVCVTHNLIQSGSQYTVMGANNVDGDGFDNSSWGSIRNSLDTENMQSSPRDRASFIGCGTSPVNFSDGPISVDPNSSTFGYLVDFNNKLYNGPNNAGSGALRFNYDGTSPENVQFSFTKDTTAQNGDSTNVSSNTATSRENSIPVPPYVTLGHSSCTVNNATLASGCGPDNENSRGVFVNGILNGIPYIFVGGARTTPDASGNYLFDYLYYSSDTSTNLNYKYIDMSTITGSVTATATSMVVQNNRVYPGFAKTSNSGGPVLGGLLGGLNAPDLGYISFNSADTTKGFCTSGSNCDAYDGSHGARFLINYMSYFGGPTFLSGVVSNNASPNWAYYIGVDSMFVFNDRIYAGNGGLHAVGHNGSIIRSTTASPVTPCSGPDTCSDWTEIGPRSNSNWHGASNTWFSLELSKLYDLVPADKAIAQFAEFNGNLYMTRTICIQSTQATTIRTSAGTASGCTDGTTTNRRAQLWKCDPTNGGADSTNPTTCESGEWSVVGDDGSGITNFGDSTNRSMTMVVKNGSYLYVGFDNTAGIRVYRTNTANPGSASSAWTQVAGAGLTDPTNVQQIFSAVSVSTGGVNYLYVSVGKNNTPVRVFRQQN
nr:Ig-like domain-containing protein [Leptospira semungkisensis]